MSRNEQETLVDMESYAPRDQQDSKTKQCICPSAQNNNWINRFYRNYMQSIYKNPRTGSLAKSLTFFTFGIYLIGQIQKRIKYL